MRTALVLVLPLLQSQWYGAVSPAPPPPLKPAPPPPLKPAPSPPLKPAAPLQLKNNMTNASNLTRRIVNGSPSTQNSYPYVVYLQLNTKNAKLPEYTNWLCGALVVTETMVLTSGACVQDAVHFYVVPGTRTYVKPLEYESDFCVKTYRRKVIWKCITRNYHYDPDDTVAWMTSDFALAKVNKKFALEIFEPGCEQAVSTALLNTFDRALTHPGRQAMIFGWGSTSKFRDSIELERAAEGSLRDSSIQSHLREVHVWMMDKKDCVEQWDPKYKEVIEKYMVCTEDPLHKVTPATTQKPFCEPKNSKCENVDFPDKRLRQGSGMAEDWGMHAHSSGADADDGGAGGSLRRMHAKGGSSPLIYRPTKYGKQSPLRAAEPVLREDVVKGFCENDHGGPLMVVETKFNRMVATGVISACKIERGTHNCVGPFLYTDIYAQKDLLSCIVNERDLETCRKLLREGQSQMEWNVEWRPEDE